MMMMMINNPIVNEGIDSGGGGLILGPVLMSLALAVLRLHASEVRRLRAHLRASGAPPTP